jgi:hypothetical protein
VIKKLHQFVEDANSMTWGLFKVEHAHHVIVVLPSVEANLESISTFEFVPGPEATRPPITEEYRVGILKKRIGGHPPNCFTVGRARGNDIVLADIEVSKVHASFEIDERGAWTMCDSNSTNGTYLNGALIQPGQKTKIKSSDTIKIGPGLSSVFFGPEDFYQFLISPTVRDGIL